MSMSPVLSLKKLTPDFRSTAKTIGVYSNGGELVSTPNTMPWILTGPKGRAVAALRASPYSNTPNHLSDGIFIFIAPRLRNLIAPIDGLFDRAAGLPIHVLHHRCFTRRVLHPILASLSDDPTPTCDPACTGSAHYTVGLPDTDTRAPVEDFLAFTRPSETAESKDSDSDVEFPEAEALISRITAEGLPPLTNTAPTIHIRQAS
ncbi:hypothetical protein B0H13DRAFT_2342989 [Mycena leptocephala]|nr:hypothetical protein B0H13DRAFT_2342989 [Mycena leptocephala]